VHCLPDACPWISERISEATHVTAMPAKTLPMIRHRCSPLMSKRIRSRWSPLQKMREKSSATVDPDRFIASLSQLRGHANNISNPANEFYTSLLFRV